MRLRPEHGWWRAVWRTSLAVGATALLVVSAGRAHDRASHPPGTPRAHAQAGGLIPSSPPPGGGPGAEDEPDSAAGSTPAAAPDAAPDERADEQPGPDTGAGNDSIDARNPDDTDAPPGPATGRPETPGDTTVEVDVCGTDPDCVQTEEDVDVCDGSSCEVAGEDADPPDE